MEFGKSLPPDSLDRDRAGARFYDQILHLERTRGRFTNHGEVLGRLTHRVYIVEAYWAIPLPKREREMEFGKVFRQTDLTGAGAEARVVSSLWRIGQLGRLVKMEAARRAPEGGDLRHASGGEGPGRAMEEGVQAGEAAQRVGLPPAGAGGVRAEVEGTGLEGEEGMSVTISGTTGGGKSGKGF